MRGSATLLLAGLAVGVSGCAAAALPLAAGVAVLHGKADKRENRESEKQTTKAAAIPSRTSTQVAEGGSPVPSSVVATTLMSLPPPDFPATGESGSARSLQTYTMDQAGKPAAGPGRRMSALLARPGDLASARAECRAASSAVFVDLDPGRGTFDPLSPGRADAGLLDALPALRSRGITVVWFSRLGENFDADVRTALATSGLDTDRRDQVVLMRTIEERKQTRREALADFLCPVALVGDERADFDELFLYLKKIDAAVALEPLLGDGWFIVSPFQAVTNGVQQ